MIQAPFALAFLLVLAGAACLRLAAPSRPFLRRPLGRAGWACGLAALAAAVPVMARAASPFDALWRVVVLAMIGCVLLTVVPAAVVGGRRAP